MNNKNLNRAGRRARASGRSSRWKKAIACLAAAALLGTAYPSEFLAETKNVQEETPVQENLPEITPSAEISGTPTPAPQEEISGGGEETSHIHTEECYDGEGSLICGNDTEEPDGNTPEEPGDSSGQQGTPEQEETEETGNSPVNTIPEEPEITDQEEGESTDTPDGQENSEQNPVGDQEKPEQNPADAAAQTVSLDETLSYENDIFSAEITVKGEAEGAWQQDETESGELAAEEQPTAPEGELELEAVPQQDGQPEYEAVENFARENGSEEEDILDITVLDLNFTYGGQPLDVSGCEITAEITPSDLVQQAANEIETASDAAEEAQAGVELTAVTEHEGQTEELDSVMVEKGQETMPVMTVALNAASPMLQVVTRTALNPTFTVQYYGRLEMLKRDERGYLRILDTSGEGNGTGGNLPTNGGNLPQTGLYVDDDGSLASEMRLEKLYTENTYTYFDAPSLPYVNIFRDNGNYTAKEVWVLKKGANPESTNETDWETYKNISQATELHFTNNPDKKDEPNTIFIEKGAVIRLVAEQTTGNYNNAAAFYDYDITDDGRTTWDEKNGQHGINSGSNYSGSGAKLAFGNANTGTGLEGQSWDENTLNQYNNRSIQGCTFGLVEGLDTNGNIIYANGVSAPKLFDDGTATGKTTINDYSLDFNRSGDTYTLSAVGGTNLDNLEQFSRLDRYINGDLFWQNRVIYTNNFWPLDSKPGKDGLTGDYYNRGSYTGYNGDKDYPPSDDSKKHNNLFGMQYSVNFTLTEDYRGPLEYYFFGDDDMWVFLDGRLVCDIGGVHSSVGMYVNLWDYIKKGDAGTHTLKFYYTERGLSGSTCYMQFTLPSVSSVPPTYQNGQLKIQKEVVGDADPDTEFSFDINIWSDDGSAEGSDYSIARYTPDGQHIESSLLSDGKGTFKLKANEYVIIDYLQHGTHYTIKETDTEGFTVSNTIDNGNPNQSAEVTGTTPVGKNSIVLFTNTCTPRLPNTGGPGTAACVFGGMLLMGLAYTGIVCRKRKGFYQ